MSFKFSFPFHPSPQGSDFSSDASSLSSSSSGFDDSNSCEAELDVLDEWPGNMKGRVRLPITTKLSGGWTATLAFSEPVQNLQVSQGLSSTSPLMRKERIICHLRARRALSMPKDFTLRTRRALSLYNVYGDCALVVLN